MARAKAAPVIWSAHARADVLTVWRYYADAASPHTADALVRGIGDAVRLLGAHRHIGRARDEVRPGLRSIAADPHVIFYRVSGAGTVEIVRVMDARRDIEDTFGEHQEG